MIHKDGHAQRLRAIPVWMVERMAPGWQEHGTSAYHAADYIDRLENALRQAIEDLRLVGDDYPGSSCQQWCHERADIAAQGMEARKGGDEGSVHDSPVHAPETQGETPDD